MDMSQYRALFLTEAREHLNLMNGQVLALEQAPADGATLAALFREAHSVKGMAATMGYAQTARLAHHLEDALDAYRKAGQVAAADIDRLLSALDLLEGLVDDLEANRPEREIAGFLDGHGVAGVAEQAGPARAEGSDQDGDALISPAEPEAPGSALTGPPAQPEGMAATEDRAVSPEPDTFQILVSLAEDTAVPAARMLLLLRELDNKGEVLTVDPEKQALLQGAPCKQLKAWYRSALDKAHVKELLLAFSEVERVELIADRRKAGADKAEEAGRSVRVRTDLLDRFVNLAGELLTHRHVLRIAAMDRDWEGINAALDRTSRLVDDLHHHVLRTRLVPLESITGRLPRMVRDLAQKSGKQVSFRLIGGDVGLDRVILDELTDPLMHLVRNAVDHGIREKGEVLVSARRDRDLVLVEVRDNGIGMDPARLREKAVERGLISRIQAESMADRDALLLVCRPGFSTAEAITETSGRGVGMDVVKSAVENLGGTLSIQSVPDEGTRFQLRLPLSIAIVKLIVVRCAGLPVALPVTRVQRIIELPRQELQHSAGRGHFLLDNQKIRLEPLATALGMKLPPLGETVCIVLAELHGALTGLLVDGFLGHRDAFVKNLGFPLNRLAGLSGATVEGDGSVLFIVDPQTLLSGDPAEPAA